MAAATSDKIKEVFRRLDSNADGRISKEEMNIILRDLVSCTPRDVDRIFSQLDTNCDGSVSYNEFVDWIMQENMNMAGTPAQKAHEALLRMVRGGSIAVALDELGIDISLDGEEEDFSSALSGLQLLTPVQLRSIFTRADVDARGYIRLGQLHDILYPGAGGREPCESVVKIFAQMDKSRNGQVGCGEFVAFVLQAKRSMSAVAGDADKKAIAAAFRSADGDQSSRLDPQELERLLGCSTDEERDLANRCFKALDTDGDGSLSVLEFSKMYGKELVEEAKGIQVQWYLDPDDEASTVA